MGDLKKSGREQFVYSLGTSFDRVAKRWRWAAAIVKNPQTRSTQGTAVGTLEQKAPPVSLA